MPKRFSHDFFTAPSCFPLLNFSARLQADGETDMPGCSDRKGQKMGWSKKWVGQKIEQEKLGPRRSSDAPSFIF
ncbi:hypothetical protein NZK35_17155 [Stieleria sp. ICT_E10.1]|uniref:hypothetical protein n=1 Tax=Stieleria sedimenti TaxID=2976331 RepID=UPI00217F25D6|nr:hypothetical protein [Stieleria sedimenti]MCS7468383.1 hypothetical protein [Stieleria sedimenti]